MLGLEHRVVPAGVDESPHPEEDPLEFAGRAARDKAGEVARRHPGCLVLAADTVVTLDGAILGKPGNPGEALAMLERLAGRTHQVHTGVALVRDGEAAGLVDTAVVELLPADRELLAWYVATGEPMDKAGAYAVQGVGGLLVARVDGHPHTVVGLPIHRLPELFRILDLELLSGLRKRHRPADVHRGGNPESPGT